jgi:hypothetical protein
MALNCTIDSGMELFPSSCGNLFTHDLLPFCPLPTLEIAKWESLRPTSSRASLLCFRDEGVAECRVEKANFVPAWDQGSQTQVECLGTFDCKVFLSLVFNSGGPSSSSDPASGGHTRPNPSRPRAAGKATANSPGARVKQIA